MLDDQECCTSILEFSAIKNSELNQNKWHATASKKNKTFNYDHFQANRKYNDKPYTHYHVFQQDSNFQAKKMSQHRTACTCQNHKRYNRGQRMSQS